MQKEINIRELKDNFVKMISNEWALLTAGKSDGFNTMTVSWGGIGELWNKDVCFVFVRPQRYTYEFIEKNDYFSLSFFGGEYKKFLLQYGIRHSKSTGRYEDWIFQCVLKYCIRGEQCGGQYPKRSVKRVFIY